LSFYRNYPVLICAVAAISIPFIFELTKSIKWDRWIGNLSYPVYIIHSAVIMLCANYLHNKSSWIVALLTLVIAILMNLLLEEPLEKLRAARLVRNRVIEPELKA
jgi:peptidoglycan/LPS O-acetylase OafA/YrhL